MSLVEEKRRQSRIRNRRYYWRHPKLARARSKVHYWSHLDQWHQRANAWKRQNKSRVCRYMKKWRKENAEHIKQYNRRYKEVSIWRRKPATLVWRQKNRIKILSRQKQRYQTDEDYRLRCVLRTRVRKAILGQVKTGSAIRLLGCSIKHLKQHLQSMFKRKMSWKNYGAFWHIDHIRPVASYDLSKPVEQRRCFHWSNLQPLFAEDNQRKSSKLSF